MRVFVTGASGWVGSALVPELLAAGHSVLGLARSDDSAEAVRRAGADVQRGSLDDLDSLRAGAETAEGVVHLAYKHDFSDMAGAGRTELAAVEALSTALEGSDRPLVITSGTLALGAGRVGTERDSGSLDSPGSARVRAEQLVLGAAERGVRSSVVRLSPTVHGPGDHGFMAAIVQIARTTGVSGYIGDGSNRWPAVHRLDAAHLFRLAVEQSPAGSVWHGVGEEGVAIREVAEVVGRHLDLPVRSVPQEQAAEHFTWLAGFLGADAPASSAITRESLGWEPTHPGLLADLESGSYFETA